MYTVHNITNPDEVLAGYLPKLNSVGPYHFRRYHDRYDVEFSNDSCEVEYGAPLSVSFRLCPIIEKNEIEQV